MKKILLAVFCFALSGAALSQSAPPYVLEDTAVHTVHAKELKRDYQIMVSLPAAYKTTRKRYPVVFVTDAPYAFPVVRALARRVGANGKGLEDFILVGLGYAVGDTAEYSRRRDYTPVNSPDSSLESDMPGRKPAHGEAEGFRRFIAADVFPLIAKHYPADMSRKVFVGHSYGSLLGLHVLFSEPAMFDQYILGSPSLWYARRIMFEREKAYAATHKDLKARIFFGVGALETKGEDMVGDMKLLERTLKSRGYPGLKIDSRVFADEDHLTLAPGLLTRGLKYTLPAKK